MFLAHFSNTSLDSISSMTTKVIAFHYENAIALYNKLNPKQDNE